MALMLFAVFDTKVGCYAPPFTCRTKGEAVRSFTEECKSAQSMLSKYPADYRLCHVGIYDEVSGVIDARGCPTVVIGADELGI